MTKTQIEILEYLKNNKIVLIYGIGDFPTGLSFTKKAVLPIEMVDEIKHISKQTYNKCN
jgi:hypothetical protein